MFTRIIGLRAKHGLSNALMISMAAAASILLLAWPYHMENTLWAHQVSLILSLALATCSMFLVTSSPNPDDDDLSRVCGGALAGYAASISFGLGLAVWPAWIIMGLTARRRARFFWLLASGAGLTLLSYWATVPRSRAPTPALVPETIPQLLPFLSSVLGSVFGAASRHSRPDVLYDSISGGSLGLVAGLPLILGDLYYRSGFKKDRVPNPQCFSNGLMTFSICAASLVAITRAQLGPGQAEASKYLLIGAMYWSGLVGSLVARMHLTRFGFARRTTEILLAGSVVYLAASYPSGFELHAWARWPHQSVRDVFGDEVFDACTNASARLSFAELATGQFRVDGEGTFERLRRYREEWTLLANEAGALVGFVTAWWDPNEARWRLGGYLASEPGASLRALYVRDPAAPCVLVDPIPPEWFESN